jgi:hypothetical protein
MYAKNFSILKYALTNDEGSFKLNVFIQGF